MKLPKLPGVYREALAMHEALRRLGVEASRIFVTVSARGEVVVLVSNKDLRGIMAEEDLTGILGERDKAISVPVGQAPEDFERVWPEACRAWKEGPERELRQIWEQSLARRSALALAVALDLAGLRRCGQAN